MNQYKVWSLKREQFIKALHPDYFGLLENGQVAVFTGDSNSSAMEVDPDLIPVFENAEELEVTFTCKSCNHTLPLSYADCCEKCMQPVCGLCYCPGCNPEKFPIPGLSEEPKF